MTNRAMTNPVASDGTQYDELMRSAEAEASGGRYKEAYNLLGRAPWDGGDVDQDVRYRRGLYAYNVAHQRLNEFRDSASPKVTLIKAGCWLARSEAYLSSAAETHDEVLADVERTRLEQERFRTLCTEFGEDLFLTRADTLRDD